MMTEAGQLIADAHAHRPASSCCGCTRAARPSPNEKDAHLIAGAAGAALCLGADFVKVNPPKGDDAGSSAEKLKEACVGRRAAPGSCAPAARPSTRTTFLHQLWEQIHVGGAIGNATGRNIHQRSLDEAVRLTKAISAITLGDYERRRRALAVFNGEEDFTLLGEPLRQARYTARHRSASSGRCRGRCRVE